MSAEARCVCCDLPLSQCGKALEERQRNEEAARRARLLEVPGWVAALYAGMCLRCGDRFPAGTPIRSFAQGWSCCGVTQEVADG